MKSVEEQGRGQEYNATCLTQSNESDSVRLEKLHAWAADRAIWIHEDVIIGQMPKRVSSQSEQDGNEKATGDGYGVYVKQTADEKENVHTGALEERQVVLLVPKSAILSPRSSTLAPYIDPESFFDHDASAGLLLSTVLLHEFLLGPKGPWWDYLQSLPRQRVQGKQRWGISLPMHWSHESEQWAWINHTEAGRIVQRTYNDPLGRIEGIGMSMPRLRAFFKSSALPLLRKSHKFISSSSEAALWNDFVNVHSIISSRAFVVDMFHGQALVPLADMFNHSDDENVHFEADDEVCDECGSLGKCAHNDDPLPSSAYGRPSAFMPAEFGPNSINWRPPARLEGVDTVDMVAQEHVDPGAELFNVYGLMSNAILLTAYGFVLEEETGWERCVWEWRNKDERLEVERALLLKDRNGQSAKRGRGHEEKEEEVRHPKHSTTSYAASCGIDTYNCWLQACSSFSGQTPSSFSPLQEIDIEDSKKQKDFPNEDGGGATLTVPSTSPFVLLTRSTHDDQHDGNAILSKAVQEAFVHISDHDGSRDHHQPLFIDATGRISWPLWRASLLATYAAEMHTEPQTHIGIKAFVEEAEVFVEKIASAASEQIPTLDLKMEEDGKGSKMVLLTFGRLEALVANRLNIQRISQSGAQAEALSIIEHAEPGALRSAVLHAFQEASALRACLEHLTLFKEILSASSA